jgi:hypothetical protein
MANYNKIENIEIDWPLNPIIIYIYLFINNKYKIIKELASL